MVERLCQKNEAEVIQKTFEPKQELLSEEHKENLRKLKETGIVDYMKLLRDRHFVTQYELTIDGETEIEEAIINYNEDYTGICISFDDYSESKNEGGSIISANLNNEGQILIDGKVTSNSEEMLCFLVDSVNEKRKDSDKKLTIVHKRKNLSGLLLTSVLVSALNTRSEGYSNQGIFFPDYVIPRYVKQNNTRGRQFNRVKNLGPKRKR